MCVKVESGIQGPGVEVCGRSAIDTREEHLL